MKKVAIILAEGFEEIEAITPFDILKRAGALVKFVSLNQDEVKGAHEAIFRADCQISSFDFDDCDMVILPGGLPGAFNLANDKILANALKKLNSKGKICAAICAAPLALARAEILKAPYTCYPGFENEIKIDGRVNQNVVQNDNIITSAGPATAMEFSLKLVEILFGKEKLDEIKSGILHK